jgi:hypothetical protein
MARRKTGETTVLIAHLIQKNRVKIENVDYGKKVH